MYTRQDDIMLFTRYKQKTIIFEDTSFTLNIAKIILACHYQASHNTPMHTIIFLIF